MAKYESDRKLAVEPYDWPGLIATLDLEEPLSDQYRIIPLDLPLAAGEMERVRQGDKSTDMSDKWDLVFRDNLLLCLRSWTGFCIYIIRFAQDGDNYRICDVLENCHPDQWDGLETTPGSGSGWALKLIESMIGQRHFEWRGEEDQDGWSWYEPPKRPRHKAHQLALRMPSIRSKFQKAFLRWFDECQTLFRIPVRLGKRTGKTWNLQFEGINPQITASLVAYDGYYELVIAAEWQGQCWDLLVSHECQPAKDELGYFCSLCEQDRWTMPLHNSRSALWEEHLFSPLLIWVNEKLAPARWLVLRDYGGSTSAELVVDCPAPECGQIVIPMRDSA